MSGNLSDCRLMEDEPRKVPTWVTAVIVLTAAVVCWGAVAWFVLTVLEAWPR